MPRAGIELTGAALLTAPTQPCTAAGAPVAVKRNGARGISRAIQERSGAVDSPTTVQREMP